MQIEDLVRMANQIAAFFAPYSPEEALAGTKKHIQDFWDPRMRRQLADHVRTGGAGLSPLALQAAQQLLASEKIAS